MAYNGANFNVGNNNQQQNKGRTTYTPIKYINPDSNVDKTRLSYEYWNSTLKIKITNRKDTGNSEIVFDDMDSAVIFLTPDKARIFANVIKNFLKDPIKYNNSGVNTTKGVVTLNNGAQHGTTNPCLIIRQIEQTDGTVQKTYAYEFKTDYHYAITNLDASDTEIRGFDKDFDSYRNLEIEQLLTMLENFINASTYAYAAAAGKANEYRENTMNNKIDAIMNKLGVEYTGRSQRSTGSFFDNNGRNSSGNNYNVNNNNTMSSSGMEGANKYNQLGSLDDIDDGLLD